MKTLTFWFAIIFCVIAANAQQNSYRVEKSISTQWTFNYFPDGYKSKYPGYNDVRWKHPEDPFWHTIIEHPGFDDSKWSIVAIPHTWSTYETTGEVHPYIRNASPKDDPYWWNGLGWYRKKFVVDKKYAEKKVFVEFEGVQKNCRVFINGKIIGEHYGGYTGFSFDLTDYINFGGENVLAVSVSNMQDDDFKVAPMSGGCWNVYGGIYRNVKLVVTDKMYIPYQGSYKHEGGTFITTPVVTAQKAEVRVRTWVKNEYGEPKECTVTTKLVDKTGKTVAEILEKKTIQSGYIEQFDQHTTVQNPLLWDADNPNMYQAYSEVSVNDETVDVYKSRFGIREFRWDFETHSLYINGKKTNLQGFNRHQEYPWLGDAIPDFIHEKDLRDMKENLNCNFIRPGQYISAPYLYDLCDNIGFITSGEFPNVKDLDFTVEIQEQSARELVRQYRNHPSILLYDVGDETNRAADSRWIREEDADRYISCRDCAGLAPGKYINLPSEEFRMAKMLNCNIRGWYDDDDMDQHPENQQQATNEQHRHEVARESKNGTSNNRIDQPNLVVWLYEDHGADREYQNAPLLHYNPKGWVDSYRVPKFAYYLWQANYAPKPMVFIHPQFWRSQYLGKKKDIEVDSNCDSVELKVNGHSLGILKPLKDNFHVVKFTNVPIKNGTLTAIGLKDGKAIVQELKMTGEPARLVLKTSHDKLVAKQNSVAIITADIVDAGGAHIYGARNTVTWEVSGSATLAGPAVYESDYYKRMEMTGTLYIDMPVSNVIRSTGEAGTIIVRAFAAGICMGEVSIKAEAIPQQTNDGILEPFLNPIGRQMVVQNPKEVQNSTIDISEIIKKYKTDIKLSAKTVEDYAKRLDNIISKDNSNVERKSPEYLNFLKIVSRVGMLEKDGLPAAEINFNISNFNRCMYIDKFIDGTQLPARFKADLKDYYMLDLITKANDINIASESKKISEIPANAPLVVAGIKGFSFDKGVIYTESMDINEIVSLINKDFSGLNKDDKEIYLKSLFTVNPWLARSAYWTGDSKLKNKAEVVKYTVTEGRSIVVLGLQHEKGKKK